MMMKHIISKSLAVLALGLTLSSCDKNTIEDNNTPVSSGAFIKFAHAAPTAPVLNFYMGSTKVSAFATTSTGKEMGLGYASNNVYPASYGYANTKAGSYTLQALDTVSVGGSAELVASQPINLTEGMHYTSFLIGKAGAFETLVIEDKLPEADYAQSYVRFVNVMDGAPVAFKMDAIRKETSESPKLVTNVGSNVSFKEHTAYVGLDPKGTYDFAIYRSGETTAYTTVTNLSLIPGRVYTLYVRGDYTTTPGTSNRVLFRDR